MAKIESAYEGKITGKGHFEGGQGPVGRASSPAFSPLALPPNLREESHRHGFTPDQAFHPQGNHLQAVALDQGESSPEGPRTGSAQRVSPASRRRTRT